MSLYIHLFVCDIVCMFIYVKQDETKTLKENPIQLGKNIGSTNHDSKTMRQQTPCFQTTMQRCLKCEILLNQQS